MNKHQVVLLFMGMMFFACGGLRDLETFINTAHSNRSNSETPTASETSAEEDRNTAFTYSAAGLIFPVLGKSRSHIISNFGDPRDNGARIHEGIDISAKRGTPVLSVSKGKVVSVKEAGLGGKQVWVHDKKRDYIYYYAHLDSQLVVEGDDVVEGDELGTVGTTGNAKGTIPHLHFGVYENSWFSRSTVDPLPLMP